MILQYYFYTFFNLVFFFQFFENECMENGEISPSTCIFFPQWLNKAINMMQNDEHGKGKDTLDW